MRARQALRRPLLVRPDPAPRAHGAGALVAGTELSRETVVVASGADAAYARALAVVARSICRRLDPACALELHVADGGLGDAGRTAVRAGLDARATVAWHAPPRACLAGLPVWGRMSPATYDKLLLLDSLAELAERAIWLDADLLVLDDLAALWRSETAGRSALAAQDAVVPWLDSPFGLAACEARRHPTRSKYFNAGVVVVDLARWRRERVVARAFDYLRRHRATVSFWDQEGLNASLAGDWGELEPRWNVNVDESLAGELGAADPTRLRAAASILHFCGRQKPWRSLSSGSASVLYYEVLDETAAAGWRPGSTLAARLRERYAGSRWRRGLRPVERLWMAWEHRATRRYLSAAELGE